MAAFLSTHGSYLLGMVQLQAPNGEWQSRMSTEYKSIVAERGLERGIIFLLDTLSDGMKYGNWPWVNAHGRKEVRDGTATP